MFVPYADRAHNVEIPRWKELIESFLIEYAIDKFHILFHVDIVYLAYPSHLSWLDSSTCLFSAESNFAIYYLIRDGFYVIIVWRNDIITCPDAILYNLRLGQVGHKVEKNHYCTTDCLLRLDRDWQKAISTSTTIT